MLQLPDLNFELPAWPEKAFTQIHACVHKIKSIGKSAGSGSSQFKDACQRIKKAYSEHHHPDLSHIIRERVDVRAFTYLISDKSFADNVLIDRALLEHLEAISQPVSKLSLMQLIRAYFIYFDEITSKDELDFWSFFIKKQLMAIDVATGNNELKTYAEHKEWLFGLSGPTKLAQRAQTDQIDLDLMISTLGMDGYSGSRFMTLARYQYYLQHINDLPVGADSPLFAEIVKPEVFNSPHENNRLLGHAILELMIDRSAGQQLTDAWQRVILNIAGDPRIPKSSPRFQKWWAVLGDKRIALVRGWLSRFDLSLFLKVLEQSAKDGFNDDMERMFTPRKVFMEGLESSGAISESRLFLSKYAVQYLRKHYTKDELPNYALVSSQDTSMIYLNIDNKVHMIEGSHSFTLKLMDKIPQRCRVNDYSVREISNDELRTTVGFQYRKDFGGEDGLIELRHDQHLNWQANAIHFLRKYKVQVSSADVIDKSKQRLFKQKFGAI